MPRRSNRRSQKTGQAGSSSGARAPGAVRVDLEEYEAARRETPVAKLLQAAAAEGTRVEREGRRRW
ncbi:MAG TPA: hypothetical protein VF257_11890 [Solirubrobacteraceae bacterium]